jgi:hypothetical protein
MQGRAVFGMGAALLAAAVCCADSITVDGKAFQNVLIRESESMYYVQLPSDGSVFSVPKSEIQAGDVSISGDAAQRDALRREWVRKHDQARNVVSADDSAQLAAPISNSRPPASNPRPASGVAETGGHAPRTQLTDVPLGAALKAMLRSKGLDYRVEDGYIWISTPAKLRNESFETPETRVYELRSLAAGTLPKVVVRDPGAAQVAYGGQAYGSSGQGYGQSYGYSQGSSAAGYGGSGGYSGGGAAGVAQRPGGMNYGAGAYGGGGGWGMPMPMTGPHFSNIADLFSNIDDRLVGETPAHIGTTSLR